MPELPEVETVKRYFTDKIVNRKILGYQQYRDNLRYALQPRIDKDLLLSTITKIDRIAKYLIINLDNQNCLVVHLGMSGRLILKPDGYNIEKHEHILWELDNNMALVFRDARRFGMVYLFPQHNLLQRRIFAHLGPEPLSEKFNSDYLRLKLFGKKIPIKNAIMDQKIVVGVGNIYASESLFAAGIHPERPSNDLSNNEIQKLISMIKYIISSAIEMGGTSLRDFVNGDNKPGYFQQKLSVYGRENQQCHNCNSYISKIIQAGRSSFFCAYCQT